MLIKPSSKEHSSGNITISNRVYIQPNTETQIVSLQLICNITMSSNKIYIPRLLLGSTNVIYRRKTNKEKYSVACAQNENGFH
uniref:Uncharacterized protein n=1 Tax=Arundo donax TaxID=35708 RepID=A0A0A8XP06_ARUDO